jgi:hypothetical protein
MTTWLNSPAALRLTLVRVSSENRKERFSSARGQSTDHPAPSPFEALRNMMRQNMKGAVVVGVGDRPMLRPNRPPPRRC